MNVEELFEKFKAIEKAKLAIRKKVYKFKNEIVFPDLDLFILEINGLKKNKRHRNCFKDPLILYDMILDTVQLNIVDDRVYISYKEIDEMEGVRQAIAERLYYGLPLMPLTGFEDEWILKKDGFYVNKRYKKLLSKNGVYCDVKYRKYISFPYVPEPTIGGLFYEALYFDKLYYPKKFLNDHNNYEYKIVYDLLPRTGEPLCGPIPKWVSNKEFNDNPHFWLR